jgi:hypothetical protein
MVSFPFHAAVAPASRLKLVLAAASVSILAACAGYSPPVKNGQTADEVTQSMGRPTARYPAPGGGERIEYARGPAGKQTYMIDMDASGHVTGWTQVLTEPNFESLKIGTLQQDVLFKLGRPSSRMRVRFKDSDVWSYRYESMGYCRWFQVSIGGTGKVVDTGYGPDPECDPGGREPQEPR